ncbi:DUF308 domain-containing protein [Candidatus Saccharibacteria bacterium]|nr:DUF308 domain-containing protein [Candidatus Saccharibacteria bacterium]
MEESSKLDKIVSSFALLGVGVCFIVWADEVTDWIALLLGALALIYAVLNFIKFLRGGPLGRTTLRLFYIILSFAVGMLLVSRASFIKEAISFVIGIYIILTSSVQLLNLSDIRRALGTKVGTYVWSVLGIIVGILCVTGQFVIPNELARLTGVVMVIYAITYLAGFFTCEKSEAKVRERDTKRIREGEVVEKSASSAKSHKSNKSK